MNFVSLLTSFSGRIGRGKFWLGLVAIVIIALGLQFLLRSFLSPGIAQLLTMIVLIYFAAALYLKRLQDRGKGMMPWLAIIFGPGILMTIMQVGQIGFENVTIEGTTASIPSGTVGWAVMALAMIVGLWALVELGFLRGTKGDNQFGPDPLA